MSKSVLILPETRGFSRNFSISQTNISKVICQDLDQNAIDMGFLEKCAINDRKSQLVYVHYNVSPLLKLGQPLPSQRFQSDLVVCLALLHYLPFLLKAIHLNLFWMNLLNIRTSILRLSLCLRDYGFVDQM